MKSTNTVALADGDYTPKVTVGNERAYCGQTFEVDVVLSGNEGLLDLYLSLSYDSSVMVLTGLKRGDALGGLAFTPTNVDTPLGYGIIPLNLLWDGRTTDDSNGTIMTFIFESNVSAPAGTYPIMLDFDPNNTNKGYGDPIAVDIENGSVTLVTGDFWAEYYDWDGTILFRKEYRNGQTPAYEGETPTREDDERYSYVFSKWEGMVSDEEAVLKYQAGYAATPKTYRVFYYADGIDNDYYDGIVTIDDFWKVEEMDYGEYMENPYPTKSRHVFSGWYTDAECMTPFIEERMPAGDISLYGYFVYDIRTTSIPKIQLTSTVEGDEVTVLANMVKNTGFNAMVLTLSYDDTALEFVGFDNEKEVFDGMSRDTTNTENGLNADKFRFSFEHAENTYETGVFLEMKFRIRQESEAGVYDVTFVIGNTEATYVNGAKGIRYTEIEIIGAPVPVGKIYRWERSTEDTAEIIVSSDFGLPADTSLKVTLVPESEHKIEEKTVTDAAGKNMELKAVYDLKLLRILGDVETEINADGTLTVSFKLTQEQMKSKNLKLFAVGDNDELVSHDFVREGETLRFETTDLGRWVIVGEKPTATGRLSDAAVMLISMPILLAIVTMAYALILLGKRKKEKEKKEKEKIDA